MSDRAMALLWQSRAERHDERENACVVMRRLRDDIAKCERQRDGLLDGARLALGIFRCGHPADAMSVIALAVEDYEAQQEKQQ